MSHMQLCGSLCHHSDTLSCICFKSHFFVVVIIPAITPAIYSITAYPSLQFPNFHWPQTFLFSNVEKCVADFIAIMEPRRQSSIGKQSCLLCFSMETPYFLQILSVLLLFALRWTHSPMLPPPLMLVGILVQNSPPMTSTTGGLEPYIPGLIYCIVK